MYNSKIRVAIVGAGAAGLVMARHLVSRPETYSVMVFEQTDQIGGTWVYTDETDTDKNGLPVHSSIYKNLLTNLPMEIMSVPDFPWENPEGPSFVHHSVVRQYLLDYAQHFNLYPHIKMSTLINNVEPERLPNGQISWRVTHKDLETQVQDTRTFDAVVVCNGHHTVGHKPKIPGIENFKGLCIHSHQYRVPEVFANKRVCILGASMSGIDISMEISRYASKIYLSHNLPDKLSLTEMKNVEQRSGIDYVTSDTFFFRDGSSEKIDVFIYCTGYEFHYPFISSKVDLRLQDRHIEPLYKYLVHVDWPNLYFMGIPYMILPFLMFHMQAQYILGVLDGEIKLPSREQMYNEYEVDKKILLDQGTAIRHINKFGDRQWPYYDEIVQAAGLSKVPPVIRKIYDYNNGVRRQNLSSYKYYRYRVIDSENFEVTYCESSSK